MKKFSKEKILSLMVLIFSFLIIGTSNIQPVLAATGANVSEMSNEELANYLKQQGRTDALKAVNNNAAAKTDDALVGALPPLPDTTPNTTTPNSNNSTVSIPAGYNVDGSIIYANFPSNMYIDSFTDASGKTTTYIGTSKEDVDAQKAAAQAQTQAASDAYHEGQTIQIGGGLQGNSTGGDLPTEADLIGQSLTLQDPSTGGAGGDTSGGNGGNAGGGSTNPSGGGGSSKASGGSSNSNNSTNTSSNSSSNTTSATTKVCNNGTCKYQMLAPITGLLGTNGVYTITQDSKSLCSLLNEWFRIGIALAGMLAVVMIVLGGFQYATTDSLFDKSEGKEKIQSALWGLLLALTTWLVLNTINPALVKCELTAPVTSLSATAQPQSVTVINGLSASPGFSGGTVQDRGQNLGGQKVGGDVTLSGGASGDYSYLNNLNTGSDATFTTYGYPGDTTSNQNDRERRGNNENLLTEGSVALSPDVISRLKPEHGAAVYVGGNLVGYYDDSSASSYNGRAITNTVDIFNPSGSLGGNSFSKNVSGAITIDNNNVRAQTHNPSK